MYQMLSHPPNTLNYSKYMPTHSEALDMLENHGLLKGEREEYRKANTFYNKCTSRDDRKKVLLDGVPIFKAMSALSVILDEAADDKYASALSISEEHERDIIIRNFGVELEKVLGIYPNI